MRRYLLVALLAFCGCTLGEQDHTPDPSAPGLTAEERQAQEAAALPLEQQSPDIQKRAIEGRLFHLDQRLKRAKARADVLAPAAAEGADDGPQRAEALAKLHGQIKGLEQQRASLIESLEGLQ